MRRTYQCLFATAILTAPMPVAAQVTVDPNALDALGTPHLPAPPPAAFPAPLHHRYHARHRHLATTGHTAPHQAIAVAERTAANRPDLEHPKNLGSSFTSLPPLPSAVPPLPAPPPVLPTITPKVKSAPKPVETAQTAPPSAPAAAAPSAPKPSPTPTLAPPPAGKPPTTQAPAQAAGQASIPPQLALPGAAPPPPAAPARLAETTPAPPAAAPTATAPPAGDGAEALPPGADRLTLPFFVQESDLPAAESSMLRDFTQRHGPNAQYIVRAFASQPAGDDDPSTPRRIALARAQSVQAALLDSGAEPAMVRLLALGNAGGTPANRVEVIAMPPASGHTAPQSSP